MLHTILYYATATSPRVPSHCQFSRSGFYWYLCFIRALVDYQYRTVICVAVDSYVQAMSLRCQYLQVPSCFASTAAPQIGRHACRTDSPSAMVPQQNGTHWQVSSCPPSDRAWRAYPFSCQCSAPSVPLWSSVSCGSVRDVCFRSLPGSPLPPLCPLLFVPYQGH